MIPTNFAQTTTLNRNSLQHIYPTKWVAERQNTTIMNMARSTLSDKVIPNNFWPKAANWSNYVLNK